MVLRLGMKSSLLLTNPTISGLCATVGGVTLALPASGMTPQP